MPRNQKIRPPSAPCTAATAMLPLTVARATVVNLRSRCCLCGSLSGIARMMSLEICGPSRNRKNSRYSITPKLTMNWNVFCPMLNACVAMIWLAWVAPVVSFCCRSLISVSPKRSSTLVTDGGRACTACWK